jgi:cold shock CspA family protein
MNAKGAKKETGTIENYNAEKGYGFISVDGQRRDEPQLFFHVTSLRCKPREIKPGARVEFYVVESVRRPGKFCAERVTSAEAENGAKL